jgi:AcrR family transcriptional regulator
MTLNTREKILQVAAKLIVRQGYTATSVSQIARETGIGKATVYHHFPDKKAIVQALLERNSVRVRDTLSAVNEEADPRKQIETIAMASLRLRSESFDLFQVIRRELPESRAALHLQLASFLTVYTSQVSGAIRQGVNRGVFRPVDPAEAARTLLSMVMGLYVQAYLSGNRMSEPEKILGSMLDIFFRGIESRQPGS